MPYKPGANINIPFDKWEREDFIEKINELQDMNYEFLKENKKIFNMLTLDPESVHKLKLKYERRRNRKNPKGAGRKPKITKELISEVRKLRIENMSYRKIAEKLGLSVGLIHKAYSGSPKSLCGKAKCVACYECQGTL